MRGLYGRVVLLDFVQGHAIYVEQEAFQGDLGEFQDDSEERLDDSEEHQDDFEEQLDDSGGLQDDVGLENVLEESAHWIEDGSKGEPLDSMKSTYS